MGSNLMEVTMISLYISIGLGRVEFNLHEHDLGKAQIANILRRIADHIDGVTTVNPADLQRCLLGLTSTGRLEVEINADY
jgi:hypothetical protein